MRLRLGRQPLTLCGMNGPCGGTKGTIAAKSRRDNTVSKMKPARPLPGRAGLSLKSVRERSARRGRRRRAGRRTIAAGIHSGQVGLAVDIGGAVDVAVPARLGGSDAGIKNLAAGDRGVGAA